MMLDEDVQTVVKELSAWMCAARTEMGIAQSRVAGILGKSFSVVQRFDTDCGSASMLTFLGYLKTIGQLEMFREAMSLHGVTHDPLSVAHRTLRPSSKPYTYTQFHKHLKFEPNAELLVTEAVAMSLQEEGYLTRTESGGKSARNTKFFASSLNGARNSSHTYYFDNGRPLIRLRLVVPVGQLNENELAILFAGSEHVKNSLNQQVAATHRYHHLSELVVVPGHHAPTVIDLSQNTPIEVPWILTLLRHILRPESALPVPRPESVAGAYSKVSASEVPLVAE